MVFFVRRVCVCRFVPPFLNAKHLGKVRRGGQFLVWYNVLDDHKKWLSLPGSRASRCSLRQRGTRPVQYHGIYLTDGAYWDK